MPSTKIPVGPVVYQLTVNGSPPQYFPVDVEVRQEFGKHEMAFIRIEYPRGYPQFNGLGIWGENAAVQMTWGRKPGQLATFYGYVNHHEIASNASSGNKAMEITYNVIGTSKPMNSETSVNWGQVSPTYIARQIAANHKLRAVLTSTNWVLPYEVQSAESDFAFLNRIAHKTGYRFWVSGGTLYFIDPAVVLSGSTSQGVPVYRLDKLFTQNDTVRDFKVLQGDNVPGGIKAQRLLYGIDQNTGQPFVATAGIPQRNPIVKINTDRVATSYGEGVNMVGAWQNLNQFWVQATAELYGNTLLYPGKLVDLEGVSMPGSTPGYWMVAGARHLMKKSGLGYTPSDAYATRVTLVRNQTTPIPAIKNTTPVRPEFAPCNLTGSGPFALWVSSILTATYDGTPA